MTITPEEKLYVYLADIPDSWFGRADSLLKCAAPVWKLRKTVAHAAWVALMLRGYAIENLLKGLWIQEGNSLIANRKIQKIPGAADHDLRAMTKQVGCLGPKPCPDLLDALKSAIRFLGRYPVSKNGRDFPIHSDDKPVPSAQWNPEYEGHF